MVSVLWLYYYYYYQTSGIETAFRNVRKYRVNVRNLSRKNKVNDFSQNSSLQNSPKMRTFLFVSLKISRGRTPGTPAKVSASTGFSYRDMDYTQNSSLKKDPKMRPFPFISLKTSQGEPPTPGKISIYWNGDFLRKNPLSKCSNKLFGSSKTINLPYKVVKN